MFPEAEGGKTVEESQLDADPLMLNGETVLSVAEPHVWCHVERWLETIKDKVGDVALQRISVKSLKSRHSEAVNDALDLIFHLRVHEDGLQEFSLSDLDGKTALKECTLSRVIAICRFTRKLALREMKESSEYEW